MQLGNFAIFFKFRYLLISCKAQQVSHVFQHERTLSQVTKALKLSYQKAVSLPLCGGGELKTKEM